MKNKAIKEKLYEITDLFSSLLSDYPEIKAKNAREALQKYLNSKKSKVKFKRSGTNCVFKTTPFYYENGQKYRLGRDCWFRIIN